MTDTLATQKVTQATQFASQAGWDANTFTIDSTGIYIVSPGISLGESAHSLSQFLNMLLGEVGLGELLPVIPESLFPKEVRILSLALTQQNKQLDLKFTLEWAGDWSLGFMDIKEPQLRIEYSSGYVSGIVSGLVSFDDTVELAVQVEMPSGMLSAQLADPSGKPVESLYNQFKLASPTAKVKSTPAKGPTLSALALQANVRAKTFSLHVAVDHIVMRQDSNKEPLLYFKRIQGDLLYQGGAAGQSSGALWGDLIVGRSGGPIKPFSLEASAAYDGQGWTFASELGGVTDEGVSLGDIIRDLSLIFSSTVADPPAVLDELVLIALSVSFNTNTQDFTFFLDAKFPKEATAEIKLAIAFIHDGQENYTRTFSGSLLIAGREFDLVFSQQTSASGTDSFFVADYKDIGGGGLNVGAMIKALSPENQNAELIKVANNLTIDLKYALLAYHQGFLMTMEIGAGVDISALPVVGKMIPPAQKLSLSFQPTVANAAFSKDTQSKIVDLVPGGGIQLPDKDIAANQFDLLIKLKIGDKLIPLELPFSLPSSGQNAGQLTAGTTPTTTPGTVTPPAAGSGGVSAVAGDSNISWFDVTQNLGPIHFQQIGIKYDNGNLTFLLNASLSAAGLSFALNGLSVTLSLKDIQAHKFNPSFDLRGLGIDFKEGPLEIGGVFLHDKVTVDGNEIDAYDGMITVQFEELALTAIGSYAQLQGHHSFFVYLALDYPLGGPPFFFVNGLAGGFGYNRDFIAPGIDQILDFELVKQAIKPPTAPLPTSGQSRFDTINQQIGALQSYIPPKIDQYFLAVGLRYSTFGLLDSFTLLTVTFGQRLEIDILGISTAVIPTPEAGSTTSPLAEIQTAVRATILPEEGIVQVQAKLTRNSYILSKKCLLTGELAFFAWFKGDHSGEFVFTVGGYHAKFNPPTYYPHPQKLGFNWQLSDLITVKGDAYFALTPHALMAGGHLEALWQSGPLSAWFKAGADFLLGWKPFYYDAEIYIDIGASLVFNLFGTHHVTVELGGDLHLWGPPFSGKVKIHYYVVSVTVSFGDDQPKKQPLTWATFRDSFLLQSTAAPPKKEQATEEPAKKETAVSSHPDSWLPDDIYSLTIQKGLVSNGQNKQQQDVALVNAKELQIAVQSRLPFTESKPNKTTSAEKGSLTYRQYDKQAKVEKSHTVPIAAVGVAPMDVRTNKVASPFTVTITGPNKKELSTDKKDNWADHFDFIPIRKGMPAALWGNEFDPDLNGQALVADVLTGFVLVPAKPPLAPVTHPIDRDKLAFDPETVESAFEFPKSTPFVGQETPEKATVNTTIQSIAVSQKRSQLLSALGFASPGTAVQLQPNTADLLLDTPQIGSLTS